MNQELSQLSLMELEDHIDALLDTQDLVTPEQEEAFKLDLQASLDKLPEKRESVAQMIMLLMSRAEEAKKRKELHAKREKRLRSQAERLALYVLEVIRQRGKDPKTDRYRKLEAKTVSLSPVKCPTSTIITDASIVPMKYKQAQVKMSGADWEMLCFDNCPICDQRGWHWADCPKCHGAGRVSTMFHQLLSDVKFPEESIRLTPIKDALEKGEAVPGARLETEKLRLEIK